MSNDYLSHTDREEDSFQGFQNLMEYKIPVKESYLTLPEETFSMSSIV